MFGLGVTELLIIALILLFFFGAKKFPEIGKGIGGAIREFKKVKKEYNNGKDILSSKVKNENPDDFAGTENKLTDKLMEQAPEVRKALDVKKKIDRVKEFIK